jgi:hypothetical protein
MLCEFDLQWSYILSLAIGSPNIWSNANPRRVAADSGVVFIDQNAHRMGRTASPLIPIFAAIDDLHKGQYEYTKLDLVTDRNNLRKLLRWATGDGDTFRIDIERAGQTCLFTRCEEKDSEHVIGFKGFGHEYEKAATRFAPGCEKATGHHRIISIVRQCLSPFDWLASDSPPTKNFGGLKILLRFQGVF